MAITFGVLLWAHPGSDDALTAYEDTVLALLAEHGGQVVARIRSADSSGPTETQVISFTDEAAFESYLADPRRIARAPERDAAIARTQVFRAKPLPV